MALGGSNKDECDEDERILVASRRGSSCIDDKWWRMTIVLVDWEAVFK